MSLIYIKESDIPKTKTRQDLIRKFTQGKSFPTYNDPECTDLQCEKGRYRSVSEIHMIVQSRFPKTSLEAIIRIIDELIKQDSKFSMIWCTQVKKVVLRYFDNATRSYMSNYSRDRYYTTKGVDGYSLKDYEEIKNNIK